jgi:hypothetical protein
MNATNVKTTTLTEYRAKRIVSIGSKFRHNLTTCGNFWLTRNRTCDLCYLPDSLPTINFPHALHRESFVPIARGILGRFLTLFFSVATLSFFWQRAACTQVGLILHLTKWDEKKGVD